MTADLRPVTAPFFAACLDFLIPREFRCVTLMSHLVSAGKPAWPVPTAKEIVYLSGRDDNGEIDGVLLFTRTGILLHCLREDIDIGFYAHEIRAFIARIPLRCVLGLHEHTRFIESQMRTNPSRAVDYILMTAEAEPESARCLLPELAGNDEKPIIVQGRMEHAELLLDLQIGYEKEEVIPPGDPFNREICLGNLRLSLDRQLIYTVSLGNRALAKAGTNARGLHWDQLGGVYTLPDWRGRGIAGALVAYTARERMKAGQKCALFVKTANEFAKKAYKKSGFTEVNSFRISYY